MSGQSEAFGIEWPVSPEEPIFRAVLESSAAGVTG
jgi:hypothetical protein